MLKSIEDINTTKKRLRIEIPSEIIEGEIKISLDQLRQKAKIPGFRQGKAPLTLIEKRFGKGVESEVLERIIPEHLGSAIKEAALDPVTLPVLDEEFQFTRNNPINLSVIVEVAPKIENLAYENIEVRDIPVEVEESDMEDTLKRLQDQKGVYEVADKEIEMDDYVGFEYVDSRISGEEIPGSKEMISKMGNEIFPPDIMERVIGKRKGDIIEFTTAFNETGPKELAGKSAEIKVSITEVKKKVLPAIDDEFAKDLGLGSVAELREKLREKILMSKKDRVRKMQKAQIVNKLVDTYAVEVPETLLQRELEGLAMQESVDAKDDAAVTATAEGGSEEKDGEQGDPQARLKERALRNARASLIINAIGKKEGIAVSDNEVEEKLSSMAARLSATREALRNFYQQRGGLENLKQSIFEDKVMDLILSKAVIEKENK